MPHSGHFSLVDVPRSHIITFKAYPVSLLRGSIKGGFGKPLVSQDSRAKLLDTPPIWSEAE